MCGYLGSLFPFMPRNVRVGLIQARCDLPGDAPLDKIKSAQIDKHLAYIEDAARQGCQVVCLQELFYGPYFPAEQSTRWYDLVEPIPDGPTTQLMMETARRLGIILIVPIYEIEQTGVYYNTASIIDADGRFLGKYRKSHLPHCHPGFWEKFYFRPGNLGYPVFDTAVGKIGIYLCYDRHFPDGARCLGLNGAEIVFNPSATVAGLSEHLWKIEQPSHAVANQYFICAINRVGVEAPWEMGEFYGSSYVCDPRGQIIAQASRDRDEVLVTDIDLDLIAEVRHVWQFYRDRRPETYGAITAL
jgi:beta-ureidopropionase